MSVTEQDLHHELEQNHAVAVDSITIEVRETLNHACFQVEPSEKCLKKYQPGAGCHGTFGLKLQTGDLLVLSSGLWSAELHLE